MENWKVGGVSRVLVASPFVYGSRSAVFALDGMNIKIAGARCDVIQYVSGHVLS